MEPMPTTHERVCCTKIGQLWQKVEEQWPETQISCITEHPGFQSICPDVWVLETAYYAHRQQRGTDNYTTGGPSSSCEMTILRRNSHGGIMRVCMGIFTTALRNKKNTSNSQKKYLTLLPQCIICYQTAYFDEKSPF